MYMVRHGVMIKAYIGCLAHVYGEARGNDQGKNWMPCSCTCEAQGNDQSIYRMPCSCTR